MTAMSCPNDTNGDGDCGGNCPLCSVHFTVIAQFPGLTCPSCGHSTLYAITADTVDNARIVCARIACLRPRAVMDLLSETLKPTQHIVTIGRSSWSATHPMIERLDGQLHQCNIAKWANRLYDIGAGEGRYIVSAVDGDPDDFEFEALQDDPVPEHQGVPT